MQARILAPLATLALAIAIGCVPAAPLGPTAGNVADPQAVPRTPGLLVTAEDPRPLSFGEDAKPSAGGVMVVTVKWPPLSVQKIPAGTKSIFLYVTKNNQAVAETQKLTRPGGAPFVGALVTAAAFPVNATGKVFIEAFAYATENPSNDSPTAWGSAQAVILDGQETPVRIVLQSGGDTTEPTPTPSGDNGATPTPAPSGTPNILCQINPALCGESPDPSPTAGTDPSPSPSGGETAEPTPSPTPSTEPSPTEDPDRVMSIDVTSNSGTTLRIPPDAPSTAQLKATVNFSSSAPADNPEGISWSSAVPARAAVNSAGLVSVPEDGTAGLVEIRAVFKGATGSIVLDVVRRGSLQLTID